MKTKIASFLTAAVFSVLALATTSFADAEAGFYDKDHIHGFVSIGGDYRGMHSAFHKYVNNLAKVSGTHTVQADSSTIVYEGDATKGYSDFNDYYIGLHVLFGAQYKQFQTWFDVNFLPTQISERPSAKYSATSSEGESARFPLYDIKWYSYGADWMFGWKIFGEKSFFNLIPAVGFGFNLINFHFASDFDLDEGVTLRNRYYSTMATTVNSELEARLEFDHLAIGIDLGYRFVRYNELQVEGSDILETKVNMHDNTDNTGDTFFIGLRLTWIFNSDWQTKQQNKL